MATDAINQISNMNELLDAPIAPPAPRGLRNEQHDARVMDSELFQHQVGPALLQNLPAVEPNADGGIPRHKIIGSYRVTKTLG